MKSRLCHFLAAFSIVKKHSRLVQDIGKHKINPGNAMPPTFAYHKWFQSLLDLQKLFFVHRTDLSHAKSNISFCNKFLVILIKNLFRRLVLQIAACLKHFLCKFFDLNISDQCQCTGSDLILLRAGRGTEHQRV